MVSTGNHLLSHKQVPSKRCIENSHLIIISAHNELGLLARLLIFPKTAQSSDTKVVHITCLNEWPSVTILLLRHFLGPFYYFNQWNCTQPGINQWETLKWRHLVRTLCRFSALLHRAWKECTIVFQRYEWYDLYDWYGPKFNSEIRLTRFQVSESQFGSAIGNHYTLTHWYQLLFQ